jgi:hypothetical protein
VTLVWLSPWSYTKILYLLTRYLPLVGLWFAMAGEYLDFRWYFSGCVIDNNVLDFRSDVVESECWVLCMELPIFHLYVLHLFFLPLFCDVQGIRAFGHWRYYSRRYRIQFATSVCGLIFGTGILMIRTWAIWRRNRYVGYLTAVLMCLVLVAMYWDADFLKSIQGKLLLKCLASDFWLDRKLLLHHLCRLEDVL